MRVSAPGKVLIAGGYLVLEPQFAGSVLAASSRFHTSVNLESNPQSTVKNAVPVFIHSPQFHQTMHGLLTTSSFTFDHNSAPNPYVEKTIQVCILALIGLLGSETFAERVNGMIHLQQNFCITLEADNDFYSQREHLELQGLPVTRSNLASLPSFLPSLKDDQGCAKIAKTGMGSSAALITSLVGAILGFFESVSLPTREHHDEHTAAGVDIVHNLAQICHSIAQEKIGSGFDVSAACYGNQQFNRFTPDTIGAFLGDQIDPIALATTLRASWNNIVKPFRLPKGMHMIMGDVNAGSATVSMVRKVLAWKSADPSYSTQLWNALNEKNGTIPKLLELLETHLTDDENTLRQLSLVHSSEWNTIHAEIGAILHQLQLAFHDIRSYLREMGDLASVAIEPIDQTTLIDATLKVPGVLFAGVPGAGGNDAIFAIVLHQDVLTRVEEFWSTWTATSVSALLVDAAPNGYLGGLLKE